METSIPQREGHQTLSSVRFIGVWDTALGAPGLLGQLFNKSKYGYHDVGLNPMIQNAYQALAVEEERKPFTPDLWTRPPDWPGSLEQTWFAGVHSNVGGGYSPDGFANEALHWIVEKVEGLGLEFDREYLSLSERVVKDVDSRVDDRVEDARPFARPERGRWGTFQGARIFATLPSRSGLTSGCI